jgi:hypothetical protein
MSGLLARVAGYHVSRRRLICFVGIDTIVYHYFSLIILVRPGRVQQGSHAEKGTLPLVVRASVKH